LAAFLPAAVADTVLNYGSGEFFDDRLQRWFAWQSVPLATQQLVTRRAELVVTLHDVTELRHVTTELAEAYASQQQTQTQLVQQEKLATIGQMAAGVAHEINNPVGFIKSNLGTLAKYAGRLRGYIDQLEQLLRQTGDAAALSGMQEARRQHKVTGALEDIDDLIAESLDGAGRVQVIVQNLKSFSRVDDAGFQWTDLHECLESSLNIAWNEIKYRARVERDYAELPPLYCCPQQLNQVFLNLLVNAAQAIAEQGLIELRTRQEGDFVVVEIEDSGCGMAPEVIECIFDPFYTTKPAGEGSGLGLSICSDIVQKHHGELRVRSVMGRGSCFSVRLPLTAGEGSDAADRPAPAASYARRLQGAVKPRSGPIGR
ncbi:MAG: ATP-binding protein, partial [Desulfuromonas thiophila]|nr:ATP-binding protein [Desulfuromonas thiophila]